MAETAIDVVAQAIYDILWATGQFKTGSPNVRKDLGLKPAFTVWWPGWDESEEARPIQMPGVVTHEFQLDIYATLDGGNVWESEKRFRRLIQDARSALKAVPRLNDACLRFRIRKGTNDIDSDGNNQFLVCSITIAVDRMTW